MKFGKETFMIDLDTKESLAERQRALRARLLGAVSGKDPASRERYVNTIMEIMAKKLTEMETYATIFQIDDLWSLVWPVLRDSIEAAGDRLHEEYLAASARQNPFGGAR